MKFQPGESGNPSGRKAGKANKITHALRDMMHDFVTDNYSEFIEDYKKLKPAEKCKVFTTCVQFVLPKLQSVDLQSDKEPISELIITTCRQKLVDKSTDKKTKNENETI